MNRITPFLWFDNNAEDAANFYLEMFPGSKKLGELRASGGVGPWPEGQIATITLELEGQPVTFLNGGPAHKLSEAFSFSIACATQQEIDFYWERILASGGTPIACGWIKDHFGLCWQVVPENITALLAHPKAMSAMMEMIKLEKAVLEQAAREQ
ncbi:MAG: VOC family protein [Acidobacteriaceae bacterium]|nr:VOC family protein [Acidobacteriaceae bacterium]